MDQQADSQVHNLVERLTAIRERLFWLAACFATTLSWDLAYEADAWRLRFNELADELRKLAPDELERITAGYESVLFSEPVRRPSIPLAAQEWHDIAAEVRSEHNQPQQPKPVGYLPDGLQRFV